MTITTILAILGGIATFAAAVKGVPIVWNGIKKFIGFIGALEQVVDIDKLETSQEEIKSHIQSINESITRVEQETSELGTIKTLAAEFNTTLLKITDNAIDLTVTAFKTHASHSSVPSFIIKTTEDHVGAFIWANDAWYNFHGIGYTEAKNGQFWDCISPADRNRVQAASDIAAAAKTEFKVTYTSINRLSLKETRVTASSWPLIPYALKNEDGIVYLGCIQILNN